MKRKAASKIDLARRAEIAAEKRARTKSHLISSAVDILGSSEGRFATIDDIILHSGLARGTFYNYFENRDDLLGAVQYYLMHHFNLGGRRAMARISDPAIRGGYWVRAYLHKVDVDRRWGWAIVNTAMSGTAGLLGEETYAQTMATIKLGCDNGRFKIDRLEAATAMALGTTIASAMAILLGSDGRGICEDSAFLMLRAFGLSTAEARKIAEMPMLDFSAYEDRDGEASA